MYIKVQPKKLPQEWLLKNMFNVGQDLDTEKLLGIRDVYMKTVMSSNYQGDIFYTRDQVRLSSLSPLREGFV